LVHEVLKSHEIYHPFSISIDQFETLKKVKIRLHYQFIFYLFVLLGCFVNAKNTVIQYLLHLVLFNQDRIRTFEFLCPRFLPIIFILHLVQLTWVSKLVFSSLLFLTDHCIFDYQVRKEIVVFKQLFEKTVLDSAFRFQIYTQTLEFIVFD